MCAPPTGSPSVDTVTITASLPTQSRRWRRPPATAVRDMASGRIWTLPANGIATIGAARSANVCVADRGVSRRHATLTRQPDGVWQLRDVSSNGTFIRGLRFTEIGVEAGDIVQIGATRLLFLDEALLQASPILDIFLGATPVDDENRTSVALAAVANAPESLLLVGPHVAALQVLAAEVQRRAAPYARLIDLEQASAPAALQMLGRDANVALVGPLPPKDPVRRALITAMSPSTGNAAWGIGLSTAPCDVPGRGEPRWPARHSVHVRSLAERTEDRTDLAAQIYRARPDLQPFVHVDALTRILCDEDIVDIAEAWNTPRWLAAVAQAGGNKSAAAVQLGVSRTTLTKWMKRHGVTVPGHNRGPRR